MSYPTLEEIIRMPKVELHRHVDGAVDPMIVWELAKKDNLNIPQKSVEELKDFLLISFGMPVEEIMAKFGSVLQVMQTRNNIEFIFCEQVLDLAWENIVYAELRFAPQFHCEKGLSLEEVIEAALDGLERGMEICRNRIDLPSVEARLIICIDRGCDLQKSEQVVKTALNFLGQGVVGIDLACNEVGFPPEWHSRSYSLSFNSGMGRTVHAGEFGNQRIQNIKTSLLQLRADRISHAIGISKEPKILEYCKTYSIAIETCPISNMVCGNVSSIEALELDVLKKEGILFNINSDDPALFQTSLSETLYQTAKAYNWLLIDLFLMMNDGVRASFLSPSEQTEIIKKFF